MLIVRVAGAVVVVAALIAVAALIPLPSVERLREWALAVGPLFPLAFFAAHVIVTVAPIPRTLFTVSAGVLFGPVTGVIVTVSAATVSAVLAFLLVRALGRDVVASRIDHPLFRAVDARLARRGWLAVGSLRLIAPVPFSVINYSSGLSSVRLIPFALATLVCLIPGTVGVVLLGDALAGQTNPILLVISGVGIGIGVLGLLLDARLPVTPLP
ncbi:MAG: TVP38/TMEM64 family protein [Rhodococcus sp. (in: high G+C Gram-positive bacteria)]